MTCKKLQASFCSGCLGLFCGVIVALQGFSGGRSSTSGVVASQGLSLASPVVWLDSSEASLSGFPPEPGGSGGRRRGKGENAVFAAGGNEVSGLCLDAVQRFFDEAQHELPLGVLLAGPLGFPLQVGLDPLEEGFGDLEGHRSSAVVRHDLVTSVFLQIKIFDQQVCDVFAGGLARRFSGFADLFVEA